MQTKMDEELTNEQLQAELEKAQSEAATNLDGWKRSQADFQNYQRRKETENKELIDFAREVAVTKMLPSLESITQALAHAPDTLDKMEEWKNGLAGSLAQLEKALGEMGVTKIKALGQTFDPHKHEAVREVPGEEDGKIVEEYQTGYEINGKVIRPSQVAISKKGLNNE